MFRKQREARFRKGESSWGSLHNRHTSVENCHCTSFSSVLALKKKKWRALKLADKWGETFVRSSVDVDVPTLFFSFYYFWLPRRSPLFPPGGNVEVA